MSAPQTLPETVACDRSSAMPLPVEQRYPLDLGVRSPVLRRLYRESNASIWDVEAELDVSRVDVDAYSSSTLSAAALSWSRRCWINFADISESEAALVRSCLERDRAADLKYVLAARGTERAVAADACHRLAARFGDFVRAPATAELRSRFATDNIRRALDARIGFDGFFAAHFVAIATIDRVLIEASARRTTEPVCLGALERIAVDVRRQELAGRTYLGELSAKLGPAERRYVAANIAAVVQTDVFSGVRCAGFLARDVPGAEVLLEAEEATAAAGLGSAPLDEQRRVVLIALAALDSELGDLGIDTALGSLAAESST